MKRAIALLFALAALAAAQKFEIASVRVSGPESPHGSKGGPGHRDATRFSCGSCSVYLLTMMAWDAKAYQISGAVSLDNDLYDVVANVPAGATKEQFRIMLQHLLEERLGLRYHMESKTMPGYELVVAKSGFLLKDGDAGKGSDDPEPVFHFPPNVSTSASRNSVSNGYWLTHLVVQLEPMPEIAQGLVDRDIPIVDHTGLAGKYSFTLDFTRDRPGGLPDVLPPAPVVFTAIQKELGLQLVAKKLPVDVVVVESFHKTPSEN
jgi:uncharacterized protein (TIGR03435 family)